jgi:hypothetical protein
MTKGKVLGCLTYVAIGFVLMFPLGMLFDDMPLFHTWGLAHGSFILAWPVLTLLTFAGEVATTRHRAALPASTSIARP